MAREMKDSGIAWIGEIPSLWDVIRTKNKYSNHKDVAKDKADDYERLALTLGGVIKRPKDDATGLQPEAFNGYQILRKNELVFKLIDLANVATSRVGYSPYTGLVSPAYIVLTPRGKHESRFGIYFFLSMWQREVFNHMGDDGVRSSLNATDLLNIPYLNVPADEQQRIANFLDKECARIDSVIELTRQSIEEYKKLKQSVITEAVTKGIRPNRPMKDSGIEWIGEIPEDWKTVRIKDLFNYRNERNNKPLEEVNLISLYTDKGVVQHSDLEETTGNKASNADGYKLVYNGDIVVNIILCWMGAIGISAYQGVTSPAYDVYSPKQNVNSKYYHYLFRTTGFNGDCFKYGRGIMMMRWRTYSNEFRAIKVVFPPLEEQQKIIEYLDAKLSDINNLISKKEKLLTELESYKKSLIYEYVTGKKEVSVNE